MKAALILCEIVLVLVVVTSCYGPQEGPCGEPSSIEIKCSDESVRNLLGKININPVFAVEDKITIPAYDFIEGEFTSRGEEGVSILQSLNKDCCNALRLMDKLSPTPELRWNSVSNKLVVAAILSEQVSLFTNGLSIKNTNSIVWTWNSGMGTGEQVNGLTIVRYEEGKLMVNSRISDLPLKPLETGKSYVWCVWAWDDQGVIIEKSSVAIPFVVGPVSVSIGSANNLAGTWKVSKAVRLVDKQDITNSFPIQNISIETKCGQETSDINLIFNNTEARSFIFDNQSTIINLDQAAFGISTFEIGWICPTTILFTTIYQDLVTEIIIAK